MNLITPAMRLSMQSTLEAVRQAFETIEFITPVLTNCTTCGGREPFTDASYSVPCATCNGTGQVASSYLRQSIKAHFGVVDVPALDPYHGIPAGAESGDYLVWVGQRDYDMAVASFNTEHSYINIRGLTFRIKSLTGEGVGNQDEYRLICTKYKPVYSA